MKTGIGMSFSSEILPEGISTIALLPKRKCLSKPLNHFLIMFNVCMIYTSDSIDGTKYCMSKYLIEFNANGNQHIS